MTQGSAKGKGTAPRATLALLLLALLGLGVPHLRPAHAAPPSLSPQRIVSMNVCTDQILMLLAGRERIASVSFLAADPEVSALAAQAAGLHLNHGLTEEILPLEPDLILTGPYTSRNAAYLLGRLGFPVLEIRDAADLAGIRENVRRIAAAIGEAARGEAVIADFDRRLAALSTVAGGRRPLAALYEANGYSSAGGSMPNALIVRAGLRNLSTELGLRGPAKLPLETLLQADPDLLILGEAGDNPSLAAEALRHPALRLAFAGRPVVRIPDRLWTCGTPLVTRAIEKLTAALPLPRRTSGQSPR
jgi:iron complex transport system substrate-binding protein